MASVLMARCAAAALAGAGLAVAATPAAAEDLVLDAASGYSIEATVDRRPVRLRVDLEASPLVVLNPDAVSRLRLAASRLRSESRVGPIRVNGFSRLVFLEVNDVVQRKRSAWFRGRTAVPGADGVVSAADLPYDRVVFDLRPPRGDETRYELQLARGRLGLHYPYTVGAQTIEFRFSIMSPQSMATAAAGALLAQSHDGRWTGETGERIVRFDILRPVRPMTLGRPVTLGGFSVRDFLVRTSDNRGRFALPDDAAPDPEEIVVTGQVERQSAAFTVSVGMDRLQSCSRLVYTRATRRLTMECAPTAA